MTRIGLSKLIPASLLGDSRYVKGDMLINL